MTAPACGSCTAPVQDGYLCTGCTREYRDLLAGQLGAAGIAADLDDAIARLLKRGAGGAGTSQHEPPLPLDLAASGARHQLAILLGRHVRAVQDATKRRDPWPEYGIASCAMWLAARADVIRQLERAPSMLAELREAVHRALAVIDRRPERVPAGQCEACGAQLLAELGADTVTCACGVLATALNDRRRERAAAADVLGTAAEISGALERIGIRIPRGTITSWASRGRLLPRPGGAYALSDVLALHAQSAQRSHRG